MTRLKMEDLMRKAAQGPSFEMPEEHMAQAMGMIQSKKKRRWGVVWFGMGLLALASILVFSFNGDQELLYESAIQANNATALTSIKKTSKKEVISTDEKSNVGNEKSIGEIKESNLETNKTSKSTHSRETKNKVTKQTVLIKNQILSRRETFKGFAGIEELSESQTVSENTVKETQIDRHEILVAPILTNISLNELNFEFNQGLAMSPTIKARNPFKFGYKIAASIFGSSISDNKLRSFDFGLYAKKRITDYLYFSVEPSVQWSLGYDDMHIVQRVDNYGLEVTSEFFSLAPQHVVNGKMQIGFGWEKNRWSTQLSPGIMFASQGFGSLNKLNSDTGSFSVDSELQKGWFTSKNSSQLTYGVELGIMYRITWDKQLHVFTGWRNELFFKEGEIRDANDDPVINIGIEFRQDF